MPYRQAWPVVASPKPLCSSEHNIIIRNEADPPVIRPPVPSRFTAAWSRRAATGPARGVVWRSPQPEGCGLAEPTARAPKQQRALWAGVAAAAAGAGAHNNSFWAETSR